MSSVFYDKLAHICHSLLENSLTLQNYYLKERCLTKETIDKFVLGYFPKDLRELYKFIHPEDLKKQDIIWQADKSLYQLYPVVIPIRDFTGKTIALGHRTLISDEKRKELNIPKYRNTSYSKSYHLFGLDSAIDSIRKNDLAFVVEGYFDVIFAHQCGFKNVVAPCGTALNNKQLILLSRYTNNICLLFDNDEPGRHSANRIYKKIDKQEMNISIKHTPHGKDLDEFLRNGGNFNNII